MLPTLLSFGTIVIAILLVLAVVIQNSKGGGLNTAFGVSNISAMIGNRKVTQGVERITWWLAGLLMGFAFLTTVFTSAPNVSGSKIQETQPTMTNPTAAPTVAPTAPQQNQPATK